MAVRYITISGAVVGLLLLLIGNSASAQEYSGKPQDPAVSEPAAELYRQGLEAFNAGDYVSACRSLGESYRIDPKPGALFTLATCRMRAGKISSAFKLYGDFLALVDALPADAQAPQLDRRAVAEQQRAALRDEIPSVKLVLDPSAPKELQVLLNGTPLDRASLGAGIPVDPGDQIIEQRLPSGASRVQRLTLAHREHQTLVLVAPNEPIVVRPRSAVSSSADHAGTRWAMWLGGVGIVGVAVGSVAGVLTIAEKSTVNADCTGDACSAAGKNASDLGKREGLISTLGFGVGIAGLATSAVLLLAAPEPPAERRSGQLRLRVSARSLIVDGTF